MRRKILMAMLVFTGVLGPAEATEIAHGVVYEDLDSDGRRGPDEPGLSDVAVSNGRDVVLSDGHGRWSIAVRPGDTVFVRKPAGWAVELGADNLPRFYYHHSSDRPAPNLRYPGPGAFETLPASLDFALHKVEEPSRFRAFFWADPQPQTAAELDYLRDDVVADLLGVEAAFGITLGDIMYDDLSLLRRYEAIVGRLGVPWYQVPGNHDVNYRADGDAGSLETFRRHFGPRYYSFDVAWVHFVVLDTVHYLGAATADPSDTAGAGQYEGRLDDDQLQWLAHDLAHVEVDRAVVLAMHIPLRTEFDPEGSRVNVANAERVLELVEGRRSVLLVAGHMHMAEHLYLETGAAPIHQHTLAAVSGAWWGGPRDERGIPVATQGDGTPNGSYLMEVDGTEIRMRFVPAGRAGGPPLRLAIDTVFPRAVRGIWRDVRPGAMFDTNITSGQVGAAHVVVNLFDGGPRSRVDLRVGDRDPVAMVRVGRPDPFVVELFERHPDELKPWSEPVRSDHLWVAGLPGDLAPGAHVLEVTAVDEYGEEHVLRRVLEIQPGLEDLRNTPRED